jgi:hypothetical protein
VFGRLSSSFSLWGDYIRLLVPRLPPRHGDIVLLTINHNFAQLSTEALFNTAGERLTGHRRICVRLMRLERREGLRNISRIVDLGQQLARLIFGDVHAPTCLIFLTSHGRVWCDLHVADTRRQEGGVARRACLVLNDDWRLNF